MIHIQRESLSPINSEKGNVLVLSALAAFVLLLAVGTATDMTRAQILQTKMHLALDAAGLAAGATANLNPPHVTQADWVQQQAQKYFDVNFTAGYLLTSPITVTTKFAADGSTIQLTANGVQSTILMSAFGVNQVTVASSSQITRATGQGMELVLVIDNTGSMNCDVADPNPPAHCNVSPTSKISVLKDAVAGAGGLLDILYGKDNNGNDNDTAPNLWVGLIPYSQAVNIGTSHLNWMDPNDPSVINPQTHLPVDWGHGQSAAQGWAGCVTARPVSYVLGENISDDPPGSVGVANWEGPPWNNTYFQRYYYPSDAQNGSGTCTQAGDLNGWNGWMCQPNNGGQTVYNAPLDTVNYGPNLFCPQPLTQMTASKSKIVTAINNMIATGDTDIDLGLEWAWRMLSPRWRGLWGGEMDNTGNAAYPALPLDYSTPNMVKVIILLTDGQPHFYPGNYTAYGKVQDNLLFANPNYPASSFYCVANNGPGNTCGNPEQIAENALLNFAVWGVGGDIRQVHGGDNSIIVYTIGYGPNGNTLNSVNSWLLQEVATPQLTNYYWAPDDATLKKVFKQIGNSLAQLRISK